MKTFKQFTSDKIPIMITTTLYHDAQKGILTRNDGSRVYLQDLTGAERDAVRQYAGPQNIHLFDK